MSSGLGFVRAARARVIVATAVAVTTALLTPTAGGAVESASPATSALSASDTVEVSGRVLVLAGEGGDPDRYSLLLPSGQTLELAEGFTAEPLSHFSGTVAVPGAGRGRTLAGAMRASTLRRAADAGTRLEVVEARVTAKAPSPGPTTHMTYVAKVTNFGPIDLTDAQILANVDASHAYWIRESGGQIPAWNRTPAVAAVASTASSFAGGCGLGNGGADFGAVVQSVADQAYPGIDFSGASPNHLVVVVPNNCGAGVASGRARLGSSLASGGPVIIDARPQPQPTLDHEYGHNVGLEHANNGSAEYGDVYEVMGAGPDIKASPVLGTVYRWEQGIIAPGEVVDGTQGGGPWALASRAAAGGQRSVVFIDPDTGRRHFVDLRDGGGADAGTCYATPDYCNYVDRPYRQNYRPGLVVERENDTSGAFLPPSPGNDGSLQAGETWSNQSGTIIVRATASNTVQVTRTQAEPLPAGSAGIGGAPNALNELTATGAVAGAGAYRYQWLFNGQPVAAAEDATFVPDLSMVGGTVAVQVTGYGVGRNPSPTTTSAAVTVAPAVFYYRNGTKQVTTVSGKTRVGEVLTASGLDWVSDLGSTPPGLSLSYKWLRNGKLIKGARKATYRLTFRDLRKRIQVKESPRAPGFESGVVSRSGSTKKVRIGKLKSPRPTIGGKVKVGKRVKARTSGWTRGTKFRYQWFAGKKALRGATGKKLRITRGMKGKKIVVKVTGRKKGFKAASAKSRPTKAKK